MNRLTSTQLDELLALQLTVAWAGEVAGERLGWWRTDLVDIQGGGDLFARLTPRTAAWAGLRLVRQAARKIDEDARQRLAAGDALLTPFHLGFSVDEQLDDRIAHHRTHGHVPADVLGPRFLVPQGWSRASFDGLLASLGSPKVTITSGGRKVTASSVSASDAAPLLFAALLEPSPSYPLPYIEAAP